MQLPSAMPLLAVHLATGEDLADAVTELRVQLRLNQPGLCEVSLRDPDVVPAIGTQFTVFVGSVPDPLFAGYLTAITHERLAGSAPLVRLRGYDNLHKLRQSQTLRGFDDLTTAEIADTLAASHGLSVGGETGPRWLRVLQTRQTDLRLLQELAMESGLSFRLAGDELRLIAASGDGLPLQLDADADLLDLIIEENHDDLVRSVTVQGWDPASATGVEGIVDGDPDGRLDLTRPGLARESATQSRASGEALAAQRAASRHVLRANAIGNAALYPGLPVTLQSAAVSPGQHYVLTSVIHTLNPASGFLTELSSAPAKLLREADPLDAPRLEATLAVVTSVADPDARGRIKAKLAALGGLETGWMPVLLPGAGPGKGLIALPAPDDSVLVLLIGGNPTQGVVLGGLFGLNAPDDIGVEGNAIERFLFQTLGGQRVTLDDAAESLTLQQSGGAELKLTPDEARFTAVDGSYLSMTAAATVLQSSGDLTIRAPGRKLVIGANAVEFEQL